MQWRPVSIDFDAAFLVRSKVNTTGFDLRDSVVALSRSEGVRVLRVVRCRVASPMPVRLRRACTRHPVRADPHLWTERKRPATDYRHERHGKKHG